MKVEKEVDQRVVGETQMEEGCTTTTVPKEDMASTSMETTAGSTSTMDIRLENSELDELPKEMHEMKIKDEKDDKADSLDDNLKVYPSFISFMLNLVCKVAVSLNS